MAKLYFRYGAMGSSKTVNALIVRYNYKEKGQNAIILKPKKENRDGEKIIRSRIGLEAECLFVEDFLADYTNSAVDFSKIDAIIVDEVQFLTTKQVDLLSDIVDFENIPVICYGLRTDFQGLLFDAAKRLMELSDVIEEIPTVCWCGRRAQFNARFDENGIVRNGEQFKLGANSEYVSLCRKHFKTGETIPANND